MHKTFNYVQSFAFFSLFAWSRAAFPSVCSLIHRCPYVRLGMSTASAILQLPYRCPNFRGDVGMLRAFWGQPHALLSVRTA